ncbi:MAG: class I SAM-dependent methyltransferase [Gemmataceae bacterium]|nr:class I SAM-dependent methyltransferase [Gemmataceae bacterium]
MAGVAAAVRVLKPTAGDHILDAGCGTGLTVVGSVRAGAEVIALDSSLQSLEILRRRTAGRMAHPVHGSLTQLPFPDDTFDAVICANVIQNVYGMDRRERCVRELARVCRPGGRVVVTVHHYSRPRRRAGWRKEGPSGGHSGPIGYIYRFVPAEFRDLLASELAVRRLTGSGFPLPYRFGLSPASRPLERWLARSEWALPWSSMLVAECRKHGGPLPPAQSTRAGDA